MTTTIRACLWMIGAIVAFTSMAVAGREVSTGLDTFEIMLWRSLIGIGIVVAAASFAGTLREVRTQRIALHGIRNVSHFAGQNLWFYAITAIPLAQVFALEFTSPLWAMLLSVLILGERLERRHIIAGVAGFIGILIVTRPGSETLNWGVGTAALAAIGFAGSAVFTRLLTRTDTITCILFWLTVMQAVFGLICAGFDGDISMPTAQAAPLVGIIAIAGLVAHFCLTKALTLAPAAVVMPIDFARLPLILLVGALVYAEAVDPLVIVGGVLIFGANYWNILQERRGAAVT